MNRDNCRSCEAPIIWAAGPPTKEKPQGATIPIDAAPQPIYWPALGREGQELPAGLSSRRTAAYELEDERGVTRARPIGLFYVVRDATAVDEVDVRRYLVSHFVTCPDAGKHSKRKGTKS